MKRFGVFKILFLLACLAGGLAANVADDLVAEWKFETLAEAVVVGETTGKHVGRLNGNVASQKIEPGFSGNAFLFQGLTRVEVPHAPELSLENDFRIEVVFFATDIKGYRTILWKGRRNTQPEQVQYYLNFRDGRLDFKAKDEKGDWKGCLTSKAVVPVGVWTHLLVTYKDGTVVFYLNGEMIETVSGMLPRLVPNDAPLYLGSGMGAGGHPDYVFMGLIDSIKISRGAQVKPDPAAAAFSFSGLEKSARNLKQKSEALANEWKSLASEASAFSEYKGPDASRLSQAGDLEKSIHEQILGFRKTADLFSEKLQSLSKNLSRKYEKGKSAPEVKAGSFKTFKDRMAFTLARAEILQMETAFFADGISQLNTVLKAQLAEGKEISLSGISDDLPALEALGREVNELLQKTRTWTGETGTELALQREFPKGRALRLKIVPDTEAVIPELSLLRNPGLASEVSLSLAGRESEGFQVVLFTRPGLEKSELSLEAEDLKRDGGGIFSKEHIELSLMKTVSSSLSTVEIAHRGRVADVIRDGVRRFPVSGPEVRVVHVRFSAPAGTPPGIYTGHLIFNHPSGKAMLPVKLKVRGFSLPLENTLRTAFSFFENFYQSWYGYASLSDEKKISIYEFLLRYRVTPNNIYSSVPYPDPALMPHFKDKGVNFATLGYIEQPKTFSEAELDTLVGRYRESIAKYKESGLEEKNLYIYSYDEISAHKTRFAAAEQFTTRIKKEFPGIRLMQTSSPNAPYDKWFNVWIPVIENYHVLPESIRLSEESEHWWYFVSSRHPFPNYYLGYPPLASRISGVMAKKNKITGSLYWCVNREWMENKNLGESWVENEWLPGYVNIFTKTTNLECGQGNLVYPGPDGKLLPSLRLENLRDGNEDYEYLTVLEGLVKEVRTGKRKAPPELIRQSENLLAVPAEVVVSTGEYHPDPARLQAFREKVGETIEEILKSN